MSGWQLLPDDFNGIVRLFPLPDLVMFPHVVQPLRVFEPRYVSLLEDASQDDRLITMALLQPGWEADYEGQPPIHTTVCVGRVISQSRRTDGSYNLLLAGVARGRVCRELELQQPYRRAEIEVVSDRVSDTVESPSSPWRDHLLEAFWRLNPEGLATEPSIQKMLKDQISLAMLTDVIAFASPLQLIDKQGLLAEPSVVRRVQILVDRLQRLSRTETRPQAPSFPPGFSDN